LFLIGAKEVGEIGSGKRRPTGQLDAFAMIQSLVRKGKVDDLVATYGQVIVDECHHVPAVSFERVLAEVPRALPRGAHCDSAAAGMGITRSVRCSSGPSGLQ